MRDPGLSGPVLDPWTAAGILAVFSVLWVYLGYVWGKGSDDVDEYMLAGRKVGLSLATATAMATWVTSNTTMVAPQLAYQMGIWGMIGYSLGAVGLLLFAPMATRIRRLMPNGYTSGDFLRLRYGTTTWRIFLVISLAYSAGWLVSLGMAGGVLIQALSGIDYPIGMTVILTICVAYTLLGGLKAVIGTDFIQTIIILVGVTTLAALTIAEVGLPTIHADVLSERPRLLDVMMPAAIMFLFNNLLFGMGEIFHSNVWWSRAFAFGPGVGFRAYFLSGLMWLPVPIVAGFIALAAPSLGLNIPAADMVGPLVAGELLGSTGSILVFIVVFSALASSLDSLLAATSDLIVEDIYRKHLHPEASHEELGAAATKIVLGLGVLTWLLCLPRLANLGELLHLTGALVASTIWPITAGLYWRRTNTTSATLGLVLGSAAGLAAYFTIGFYVAALVSAGTSMVLVVGGSLLAPGDFDWATLDESAPAEEAA